MSEIHGSTTLIPLIPNATATSTVTGTGVDISLWDGVIKVIADVGAVSGTTPTCAIKIQDSADNSTYADVTGATFTGLTTVSTLASIGVNTQACRQYIRAVATLGGTTPNYVISVNAIGSKQVY